MGETGGGRRGRREEGIPDICCLVAGCKKRSWNADDSKAAAAAAAAFSAAAAAAAANAPWSGRAVLEIMEN